MWLFASNYNIRTFCTFIVHRIRLACNMQFAYSRCKRFFFAYSFPCFWNQLTSKYLHMHTHTFLWTHRGAYRSISQNFYMLMKRKQQNQQKQKKNNKHSVYDFPIERKKHLLFPYVWVCVCEFFFSCSFSHCRCFCCCSCSTYRCNRSEWGNCRKTTKSYTPRAQS